MQIVITYIVSVLTSFLVSAGYLFYMTDSPEKIGPAATLGCALAASAMVAVALGIAFFRRKKPPG